MHFSSWTDSGYAISQEEISSLFSPFVVQKFDNDDPEWRAEIRRRKFSIFRKYLKSRLSNTSQRTQRTKQAILDEYSKAWHQEGYENYRLNGEPPRLSPWEYLGQNMFASDIGGTRVRQLILVRMLERLKIKRVVEIGCGNGINLLLLAGRFPDIEFTGLELTPEGQQSALRFQEQDALPEVIAEYAPLPLKDHSAFKRVRFLQGTAADLPFKDGEFDLAYTILALEQMEGIRRRALREIARIVGQYTLMLEPFRDVNASGWPRVNVIRRKYFQGYIDDLPGYGLNPVVAIDDFPQETFLKACVVLSEKET